MANGDEAVKLPLSLAWFNIFSSDASDKSLEDLFPDIDMAYTPDWMKEYARLWYFMFNPVDDESHIRQSVDDFKGTMRNFMEQLKTHVVDWANTRKNKVAAKLDKESKKAQAEVRACATRAQTLAHVHQRAHHRF